MKLVVDKRQRLAKMRAHTGTHLLHAALDKILNGTRQAGSLVDEDYLRFDFASDKLLSPEQLRQIEDIVNNWIAQ
jgi:alanyl-tRNA synthetase